MYDLTSAAYRFHHSVAEGDFFAALGLAPGASSLDVDVAAARLADHAPGMAGKISTVANVLTHRQRRAVYGQLCALCDRAIAGLGTRLGDDFSAVLPDYRRDLWQRSCRLLRFELDRTELATGPKGAASLARRGADWIVAEFLAAHVRSLGFSEVELRKGRAARDCWSANCHCGAADTVFLARRKGAPAKTGPDDESQAPIPKEFRAEEYEAVSLRCQRCEAIRVAPSRYVDTFNFSFPPATTRRDVVRAEGQHTGQVQFFYINRRPPPPRDSAELLQRFYALQEAGRDVTLEEAEAALRRDKLPSAVIPDIFHGPPELGEREPRFTRFPPTPSSVGPATKDGQTLKCLGSLAFAVVAIVVVIGLRNGRPVGRSAPRPRMATSYQPAEFRPLDQYLETERERARAEILRQALETDNPIRRKVCEKHEQCLRDMRRGHHCQGNPCPKMRKVLEIERLLAEDRIVETVEQFEALHGR